MKRFIITVAVAVVSAISVVVYYEYNPSQSFSTSNYFDPSSIETKQIEYIFDDEQLIGNQSVKQIKDYAKSIDDQQLLNDLTGVDESTKLKDVKVFNRAFKYTDHSIGYISNSNTSDILDAEGKITADNTLIGKRIKVTVDRIYVYQYPGGRNQKVLFKASAANQVKTSPTETMPESVHFSRAFNAREGGGSIVNGFPIFTELNVGGQGISFEFETISIANERAKSLASALEGETMQNGLALLPVLNPYTRMISGISASFAQKLREKEKPVQHYILGLDFETTRTRSKLKEGSYIAIQVPEKSKWDWSQWKYENQSIVKKDDPTILPEYNYIIFSISKQ
jgi:hypothetical protein